MDGITYRRRVSGKGSRVAGKRHPSGVSPRERRRFLQLCASIVLFLLVFLGRDVLPGGVEAWSAALNRDMDLQSIMEQLARHGTEAGSLADVLKNMLLPDEQPSGGEEVGAAEAPQESVLLPLLPSFPQRLAQPGIAEGQRLTAPVEEEEPAVETGETEEKEEPVVTAVAQLYTESGEALPERVSLLYYNLGLEETMVPAMGTVTSDFGFRNHPVSGEYSFHTAVDVGMDVGTEILAFADGTVRYIGENGVFGLYVKLDHGNGVSTFYAHCDKILVDKGERVVCGQVIARSGETGNATGPHLHFSLEKDGIRLDPEHYLKFRR